MAHYNQDYRQTLYPVKIQYSLFHYFKSFITLHGFPATTQSAGILFVTTLPAPMMLLAPIVTPLRMIEWTLTQTSSSITIGGDFVPSLDVHQ